jgi:DNA-binding LytR/AlgR family response regulator
MDKIIIIDDSGIANQLEAFLTANREHIRLSSDMDEISLGLNPVLKEIVKRYEEKHKIKIKSKDNIYFFKNNEIVRFEAKLDQTSIFLVSNEATEVNEYIDNIEEQLKNFDFLRIHTNHIINVHFISKIFEKGQNTIELTDGTILPVSDFRKELINKYMDNNL